MAMTPMSMGGGTWTNITTSGVPTGTAVKYKKDNEIVNVNVVARNTTVNTYVTVGQLPANAYPAQQLYIAGIAGGNGVALGAIFINTSGEVQVRIPTGSTSCYGDITFLV